MLLIGSRAVKYHYPDARDFQSKYDFIAYSKEIEQLEADEENKVRVFIRQGIAQIQVKGNNCDIFTYVDDPNSWERIPCLYSNDAFVVDEVFTKGFHVANPAVCLLIKKRLLQSKMPLEYWKKCFDDYFFLKERVTYFPIWFGLADYKSTDIYLRRDHRSTDKEIRDLLKVTPSSDWRQLYREIKSVSGTDDFKSNLYYLVCGYVPNEQKIKVINDHEYIIK